MGNDYASSGMCCAASSLQEHVAVCLDPPLQTMSATATAAAAFSSSIPRLPHESRAWSVGCQAGQHAAWCLVFDVTTDGVLLLGRHHACCSGMKMPHALQQHYSIGCCVQQCMEIVARQICTSGASLPVCEYLHHQVYALAARCMKPSHVVHA